MDEITYNIEEKYYDREAKKKHWGMAIGLQDVDDLKPSSYLKELANQNIEGKLSNYDVKQKINEYYKEYDTSVQSVADERECDLVSIRIVELLENQEFIFTPTALKAIHGYLFKDIYTFAGKYRDYNITKNEPILNGETVKYCTALWIESALEEGFNRQKGVDYSKLSLDEQIKQIVEFTARIWQVHPFGEGNTRTTAVFIEMYFNTLGFKVNNQLFEENSKYFRNALVRANYGVKETDKYLLAFFENLLKDETHILDTKELVVKELFKEED